MADNDLVLTPCSKQSRGFKHLKNTVIGGVERSRYAEYTDQDYGDRIAIWGSTDGTKRTWDSLEEGDYLLFYIGDETYRYAAKVLDKEENLELANDLWPDYATTSTGGDDPNEPWRWVIYLDEPIEVDIDGAEIHGFADHDINYTFRFMQLNDSGIRKIREKFGSVDDYIRQRATNTSDTTSESSNTSSQSTKGRVDRAEAASDLRPAKRVETQVSRMIRNTDLSRDIKERYQCQCQVCGTARQRSPTQPYAESHHLHPLGDSPPGPDAEENILVLCPNHHADFDYGMIRVDPDTLEVHHGYDDDVEGNTLHVRNDHHLDREYLEYHNREKASF